MTVGFPLDEYLARIGVRDAEPDLETLRTLHRAQVMAIPFENLNPLTGRPVLLETPDLVRKMIAENRGGYCFELNGLFLAALNAIGFRTRPLAARVAITNEQYGVRSHQITLVEIEGRRWIADVGFGGNGLIDPVPLEEGFEEDQGHDCFRVLRDDDYGWRLEHKLPTGWRISYAFSLDPFLFQDYQLMNYYVSRSPDSLFTRIPLCCRVTQHERRIIFGNTLKIRREGQTLTTPLETSAEFRNVLARDFGLELPADFVLPDPQPAPPTARQP